MPVRPLVQNRGKLNVEGAPFPLAAANPDHATVEVNDELAERKPEPRAANARGSSARDLAELAEDDLVVLGRNARPVIGEGEQHRIARPPRAYRQLNRVR